MVKPLWIGLLGCVVCGVAIGSTTTYILVSLYESSEIFGGITVDRSHITDAIIWSSVEFTTFALIFYATGRFKLKTPSG
jgi:ABC-type lipoprotein release transport system permease subunit